MTFGKIKFYLKNPNYMALRVKGFILNLFSPKLKAKYLNLEETINYIVNFRVSIGRIGDGEMLIMSGKNQYFQKSDFKLKHRLLEVKTTNNFLLCLPILSLTNKCDFLFEKKEILFWADNRKYFRYKYIKIANNCSFIGEAFISRFYLPYKNKNRSSYINLLKQVWNDENVVFVEGYYSRVGVGNDLFDNARSIKRILCPPENAFDKYDEILNYIIHNISKDYLLIIALGPTATVLAYDLSYLGYWAVDLGHIDIEYEWYKKKATQKTKIDNKYCGEVDSKYPNINFLDIKNEIIHIIK